MSHLVKRVWRDLICPFQVPPSGLSIPVVTQIGSSPISQPLFQINYEADVIGTPSRTPPFYT